MAKTVDAWMAELTLEEKASLCSGQDFWTTKAVERLGIPSWMMTDGPHGLRKQKSGSDAGLLGSVPATCFPSGVALASSWNRTLIEEVGRALGEEAKANQVGVVLGPAVNIKRSPLCGRNFEYLSEDPFVAGEMAKHHILGVQSQGIGASIKHFAANNQERLRMTIDAIIDERTLREIYLPAFETAVKGAQPWTVMCSYNRLNGTYAAENRWLLTQVLKEEWGHTGLVVTDWGANNDRPAGIRAGQELEMPGNGGITDHDIVAAVHNGTLSIEELDRAVRRILTLTAKVAQNLDPQARYDADAHHALARRAAAEGMVLLKNEGSLLPLRATNIALIGAFAQTPRYQGGGSSHITPTRMDSALDEVRRLLPSATVSFAEGYRLKGEVDDGELLAEVRTKAAAAQVAVVFVGLTDVFESEGFDRSHLEIPPNHTKLLEAVLAVQKNVVVVLSNGSPVTMPWASRVPAILEGYLGGQAWGGAVADLLCGKLSPSGKLAETFPLRLEDNSAFLNFPGDGKTVEYREGIFVGYRHHDAARVEPLFPFGHGLSYSTFSYGSLRVDKTSLTDRDTLQVTVAVTNTGTVAAAEVTQLYVGERHPAVLRPVRELKGFAKVFLAPGETKDVAFTLDRRAFAHWSVREQSWVVTSGAFELAVGSSSRDLRTQGEVTVRAAAKSVVYDTNSTLSSLLEHPVVGPFVSGMMKQMESSFGVYEPGSAEERMMQTMVAEMPLRNLVRFSAGRLPPAVVDGLIGVANGTLPASALAALTPR